MSGERYSRQSFLGEEAESRFATCGVGVVGLGGGGSHVVQQLAHLGFQQYVLFDPDVVESSNLNRLVGATEEDVRLGRSKVAVAERVIRGLQAHALIDPHRSKWQDDPQPLRRCDLIFGCVDGLNERRELETIARRFLIPYLDLGLDVHRVGDAPPVLAGQVVLSMPGGPCLTCLGVLTESGLSEEAARYGDAGPRPQVVWANGVLASLAVGVAVDLLTDWTRHVRGPVFLVYQGNEETVQPSKRLNYLPEEGCSHFSADQVGEVNLPIP